MTNRHCLPPFLKPTVSDTIRKTLSFP